MYNEKLANKLYDRKVFKKHVFHLDNTENYFWDDTTYGYKMNTSANLVPKPPKQTPKTHSVSCQTLPKFYLQTHNLNIEPFKTT